MPNEIPGRCQYYCGVSLRPVDDRLQANPVAHVDHRVLAVEMNSVGSLRRQRGRPGEECKRDGRRNEQRISEVGGWPVGRQIPT